MVAAGEKFRQHCPINKLKCSALLLLLLLLLFQFNLFASLRGLLLLRVVCLFASALPP